jgi:hypothetical protein
VRQQSGGTPALENFDEAQQEYLFRLADFTACIN